MEGIKIGPKYGPWAPLCYLGVGMIAGECGQGWGGGAYVKTCGVGYSADAGTFEGTESRGPQMNYRTAEPFGLSLGGS